MGIPSDSCIIEVCLVYSHCVDIIRMGPKPSPPSKDEIMLASFFNGWELMLFQEHLIFSPHNPSKDGSRNPPKDDIHLYPSEKAIRLGPYHIIFSMLKGNPIQTRRS